MDSSSAAAAAAAAAAAYLKMKKNIVEFDSESAGSSEDIESPRSVWKNDYGRYPVVHHQVLKIRDEDTHLGEDVRDKIALFHLRSNLDMFFKENRSASSPMLPASPLSGKTAIKSCQ